MEGHAVDWKDGLSAAFISPMALEGVLAALCGFSCVKVLHGHTPLDGAQRVAGAIGVAAYTSRLVLQRRLPVLLWCNRLIPAAQARHVADRSWRRERGRGGGGGVSGG